MQLRLKMCVMGLAVIAIAALASGVTSPVVAESAHGGHTAHTGHAGHSAHGGHAGHSSAAYTQHEDHASDHGAPGASAPEGSGHSGHAPCGEPWHQGKHCPPCHVSPAAIAAGAWTRTEAAAKTVKLLPPAIAALASAVVFPLEGDDRLPPLRETLPYAQDDLIILTGRLRI
jgi:hypothetical protein